AIQTRIRDFRDKKLRPVRVRSGIGIGESARPIKLQSWGRLILERIPRVPAAVARRIATLDHELWYYAMENSSIVKRDSMFLGVRHRASPVLGTVGQTDEICHSDRSFIRKQLAGHLARTGVDDGRGLA